jgi:O-acetyl-ADP-ribose deacetylase (regulator of RNase III)
MEGGLRFDDLGGVATAIASAFGTAALGHCKEWIEH